MHDFTSQMAECWIRLSHKKIIGNLLLYGRDLSICVAAKKLGKLMGVTTYFALTLPEVCFGFFLLLFSLIRDKSFILAALLCIFRKYFLLTNVIIILISHSITLLVDSHFTVYIWILCQHFHSSFPFIYFSFCYLWFCCMVNNKLQPTVKPNTQWNWGRQNFDAVWQNWIITCKIQTNPYSCSKLFPAQFLSCACKHAKN